VAQQRLNQRQNKCVVLHSPGHRVVRVVVWLPRVPSRCSPGCLGGLGLRPQQRLVHDRSSPAAAGGCGGEDRDQVRLGGRLSIILSEIGGTQLITPPSQISHTPSRRGEHRTDAQSGRAAALAVDIGRQARWCSYFRLPGIAPHERPRTTTSRMQPVQALLRWTGQGACRNVGPPHPCREVLARPGSQKLSSIQTYRSVAQATINATVPSPRPKGV
jgi:hypothetical protein